MPSVVRALGLGVALPTIPDRVLQWLPQAKRAGEATAVDALDLLALCDRESEGNPNAQSADGGFGLFQITRPYHDDFLSATGPDGKPLWRDPDFNSLYAAKFLRWLANQFEGLAVDTRLCSFAAFNAGAKAIRDAIRPLPRPVSQEVLVQTLDKHTTNSKEDGPYVASVLRRRNSYVLST